MEMGLKKVGSVIFFRLTFVICLLLMGSLVFLTFVALWGQEELHVVAQFFPTTPDSPTLREFNQLTTLSPIEKGNRELMEEMLMRHYLEMRYEQIPDAREMRYRWGISGPVYTLSTLPVYNEFAANLQKKLEDLPDVVITIDNVEIDARNNNSFTVNFSLLEHMPTGQIRVREKNVVLEFRYGSNRPRWDPRLINPYGLIFVRVEERERKRTSN